MILLKTTTLVSMIESQSQELGIRPLKKVQTAGMKSVLLLTLEISTYNIQKSRDLDRIMIEIKNTSPYHYYLLSLNSCLLLMWKSPGW